VCGDVRIPFLLLLVVMAKKRPNSREWSPLENDKPSWQRAELYKPKAPRGPESLVRIGEEADQFIYFKRTEDLWGCVRCSDEAPQDGRTWRLFVRFEDLKIVVFEVVMDEVGLPTEGTEVDRMWTCDMLSMEEGLHYWAIVKEPAPQERLFIEIIL
jgi:hypothetical protein